jgi:hypothetical protein
MVRTSDGSLFDVDASTGTIVRVSYPFPARDPKAPESVTVEQASGLARRYAEQRFPQAMRRLNKQRVSRLGQTARVSFEQVLPQNGAYTQNNIAVDVSLQVGSVVYVSVFLQEVPVEATRPPRLTLEQTKDLAKKASGLPQVESVDEISLAWVDSSYRRVRGLLRQMKVSGLLADGRRTTRFVTLDANTGAVFEVDQLREPPRPVRSAPGAAAGEARPEATRGDKPATDPAAKPGKKDEPPGSGEKPF